MNEDKFDLEKLFHNLFIIFNHLGRKKIQIKEDDLNKKAHENYLSDLIKSDFVYR